MESVKIQYGVDVSVEYQYPKVEGRRRSHIVKVVTFWRMMDQNRRDRTYPLIDSDCEVTAGTTKQLIDAGESCWQRKNTADAPETYM